MRSFVSLRLTAHVCFAAALLCMAAPIREDWLMFALIAALTLLTSYYAFRVPRAKLRLLLGLIPLLALPLATGIASLATGLLLVGYVAASLASGRVELKLWQYRREVFLFLWLCLFFALFSNMVIFFQNKKTLAFLGLCVLQSMLALRAMRLGFGDHYRWEIGNPIAFTVPMLCGAAIGALFWLASPLINILIAPVRTFMTWLTLLLSKILGLVSSYSEESETNPIISTTSSPATEYIEQLGPTKRKTTWVDGLFEAQVPWKWIVLAVAGIAILVLIVWLLHRSEKLERKASVKQDAFLRKGYAEVSGRRRRRKVRRVGTTKNRQQIRAIYREYLDYLRQNGASLHRSDTTEEITGIAEPVLRQSDVTLRGIYRLARYGEAEPDDEKVAAAKAELASLTTERKSGAQEKEQ